MKLFSRLSSQNSHRKSVYLNPVSAEIPEQNNNYIQPNSTIKTHACMDFMTYNTYTVPKKPFILIRMQILLTNLAPKIQIPILSG